MSYAKRSRRERGAIALSKVLCKFVPPNLNVSNILHHVQETRKHLNKSIKQQPNLSPYRQLEDVTQEHIACLLLEGDTSLITALDWSLECTVYYEVC
jgi:hypothetical protein